MQKILLIVLAATALALAGCAANDTRDTSRTMADFEYMNQVEHHAKRAGVEVYWVNPPRRERAAEEENDPGH